MNITRNTLHIMPIPSPWAICRLRHDMSNCSVFIAPFSKITGNILRNISLHLQRIQKICQAWRGVRQSGSNKLRFTSKSTTALTNLCNLSGHIPEHRWYFGNYCMKQNTRVTKSWRHVTLFNDTKWLALWLQISEVLIFLLFHTHDWQIFGLYRWVIISHSSLSFSDDIGCSSKGNFTDKKMAPLPSALKRDSQVHSHESYLMWPWQ